MYSVSDEAFGLVMSLNELHIWNNKAKGTKDGYSRKRFVNGHSRSKKGWSTRGIDTYNRIFMHLSIRQKEDCSTELKAAMKKRYMDAERHKERRTKSGYVGKKTVEWLDEEGMEQVEDLFTNMNDTIDSLVGI